MAVTLRKFLGLALVIFLSACGLTTTRPKLEMRMAQSAFVAAKASEAQTLAPGLYRKAEFYYLKAKSSYKRKYFNKAKQYAILSKKFAEKAEYVSIRKKALDNL
jgi:hypothetical protein